MINFGTIYLAWLFMLANIFIDQYLLSMIFCLLFCGIKYFCIRYCLLFLLIQKLVRDEIFDVKTMTYFICRYLFLFLIQH